MPPNPAKLNAVVYGRFEVSSIRDWRTFMDIMYGLELKPAKRRGEFEAVIDDAGSRLLFTEGPANDLVANGWLCDDLDGLKERIEAFGAKAEWASDEDAKQRGASRLLRTFDPTGLTIEAVDRTSSHADFTLPKHDHAFKAGALGLGHFTFQANDLDEFERFYVDALGLEVTDYNDLMIMAGVRVRVGFYRANPRHHSVACASLGIKQRQRLNHFFLEVQDHHAVGRAFQRIRDASGTTKAIQTEDRVALMRPQIATAKAWGCLGLGFSTRTFTGMADGMGALFQTFSGLADNRIIPSPGGVLIARDGVLVGSIGVSGDTGPNDELCAVAGVEASELVAQL